MSQRMADAKRSRGSRGVNKSSAVSRAGFVSARYTRRYGARAGLQRAPGMQRESGYVDLASAAYALDTTGSVTLLNAVAQGAGVQQRVGKKIVLKGLQCRGYMANGSTATFNDVAFLIVYDKRPTGALPAVTDILVSATSSAMNNDTNSGRFSIIKRVDSELLGNTTAAANYLSNMMQSADFYLPLKGLPTVYKAAGTGAIGDIEEGALYLVTVGSNAAGTTAASAALAFRLRFIDI
jgi:hypothetical protein